jgi:hypothetical protein
MKTHKLWMRATLAALLAAGLCQGAPSFAQSPPAGGVTELAFEHDDDHMMMTWLGVALNDYANAMTMWLVDAARASGGTVSPRALSRFQGQLRRATFAYFEYTFEIEGVPFSRIYLAASGRPFATYIDSRSPGLVAPERPDSSYFPSDDVVRHASAGGPDESEVTPRPNVPGLPNRGNDAEIKVLQSIMRDIAEGNVGSHGRLTGFVSKQPCESCSPALRQFALETGSEVHVNYVHGANEDGLRTPVWMALRQARETLISDLTTMFTQPTREQVTSPEHPMDDDTLSAPVCRRI